MLKKAEVGTEWALKRAWRRRSKRRRRSSAPEPDSRQRYCLAQQSQPLPL